MMNSNPESDGSFRPDRIIQTSEGPASGEFKPFDHLPVMVFEIDHAGCLVNANKRFVRVLGLTRPEVVGRPLDEFLTRDSASGTLLRLVTLEFGGATTRDLPVRFVRADGEIVEAKVSTNGPDGCEQPESVLCVAVETADDEPLKSVQATLVGLVQAANCAAGLTTFLDVVRLQMGRLMDTTGFYVVQYDAASNRFEFPYQYDRGVACHQADRGGTVTGLDRIVLSEMTPKLVDRDEFERLVRTGQLDDSPPPDFRAWMGAPLRTRRGVIGLVGLSTHAPREAFGKHHLEYLTQVADHVALAVERYSNEERLSLSEQRYRLIFDRAGSVIILLNPDGTIVDCNRRITEMTGFEPADLIGQSIARIVHPGNTRRTETSLKEVITKGTSEGCDFKMAHRDGHELDVVVYSSGLTDAGGESERTICVIDDITRRRQTEEALRASEETNRALFVGCSDAIAIRDLNDVFVAVNPAMEKLFGYTAEELIGRRFPGLESIDEGKFTEWVQSCRSGECVSNYETVRPHKSGQLIPVSITVSPVTHSDGTLHALSFFYRDLSMRRKTEYKLAEMQQLESLSMLAGGIAHDFNNIMTAILGNIDLALLDVDTEGEVYDHLTDAETALTRAQGLTQQLLSLSRRGGSAATTEVIPEIITDSAGFALAGSRTKCEFDFAEDLEPVEVDRAQFSQVIHNLIINADQAMPDGGVIRIMADNLIIRPGQIRNIEPGKYIRISIKDHGAGIPREYLERVFEPFFTTRRNGNGLGLAASVSIIRRHHGHIDIESEVGRGTTLNIYLPALPMAADERTSEAAEELPVVVSGRALVMDDEEAVRQIAGAALTRMGFTTDLVADGQAAIKCYRDALAAGRRYELVVLDLTVPGGMGAEETVKRLKELDPEVRAIVVSGYANDPRLVYHKRYGFVEYIVKPFRVKEMRRIVSRVLREGVQQS